MQTQKGFKKLLPDLIAIGVFLVLAAFFCMPALKGNRIAPHDTVGWLYMSKEARDYAQETGENPGWTNNMFGGMPSDLIFTKAKGNYLYKAGDFIQMQPADFMVNPIGLFFVAMLGCFLLLRAMNVNTLVSAAGAIAYAFASYHPVIIVAGHITKMLDLAHLPGLIAGIILVYRQKYWQGILTTVLYFSFVMVAAHFQIIFYSIFLIVAIVLYFLVAAIRKQQLPTFLKSSGILLACAAVVVLSSYLALKGTSNYAKYSIRGGTTELTINKQTNTQTKDGGLSKDYAFAWSNGIGETFCLIVPNLYGGSSGETLSESSNYGEALNTLGVPYQQVEQMVSRAPTYWGPQTSLSGPVYVGAIVCFLFVLSLFVIRSSLKWWIAGAGLLFMMFSWGKNFEGLNYFLFDNFPLFNKFRSPNMAMSLVALVFVMLGFWGLYEVFSGKFSKEELLKKLKLSAYITGGIVVLIIIATQTMLDYKGLSDPMIEQNFGEHGNTILKALRNDRSSMALKDSFRSLIFIAIAIAAIWAFLKEKISKTVAIAIVGIASAIDVMGVASRYIGEENYMDEFTIEQQFFTPRPVDAEIMKDPDPFYRVMDMTIDPFNDGKASYFHKTIGGYHPAKLETYQELIEVHIGKLNSAVMNMLNTKYFIVAPQQQGAQPSIMPNPTALGNGWFVDNIKYTKTADETMLAMEAPSLSQPAQDSAAVAFNPAQTAIIRDNEQAGIGSAQFNKDSSASVQLTNYVLNHTTYETNNPNDGFAVFSEIFYPENWKALIDGKETKIYNVNYVLRGLKIPAGKHKVEFIYSDENFKKAESISVIGSILAVLLVLGAVVWGILEYRKGKHREEVDLLN